MFFPPSAFPQQPDGAAGNARSSAADFPSAVPSSASGRGRSKQLKGVRVADHFEMALNLALEQFLRSDDQEASFPLCFTSDDRAFAHRLCQSRGLISKSKGKGSERYLTVRKKDGSEVIHAEMTCCLTSRTKQAICNLICRLPLTNKERIELLPRTQRRNACAIETENKEAGKSGGQLSCGIPQVPLRRGKSEYDSFRQSLPVFEKEEEIVKIIKENKVVLIIGETGSGKTTQIPQFLLDDCYENGIPCCIFCTQPRRLAVIAVAERVAAERREQVGQTVGYQVRLQSRTSPRTLLTFCTSGVLLRTLMAGESALSTVTHVIVDEVHERDRFTDFLLIKLRDILQNNTNLKLIISGAALDTDLFIKYFGSCPVIHIKGRRFEVKEMFLEDILRNTGYINKEMVKYIKEKQREEEQQSALTEWCSDGENSSNPQSERKKSVASVSEEHNVLGSSGETVFDNLVEKDSGCLEPWLIKEMDFCLSNIWLHKDTDSFSQVFHFILTKNISVDYRHSETSATALMIASGRGFTSQVEQLISMGASIHCKSSNGWMALDWAKHFGQTEVVDLLESYGASVEFGNLNGSSPVQTSGNGLAAEDQELLKAYQYSLDDEEVDLDLIMHLLYDICNSSDEGAILVFLPGYDEIIRLRNCIIFDDRRFVGNAHRYQVFMLHSNMQTLDQENVLKTPPSGIRKIILSTNIAETSITISDVVFVIDSGKMKEKSFDALSCVTVLKTVWISKASAIQRRGRAGRCQPGVCFHLFSRIQFQNMLEFQTPELGRMPLQELCLHTKLLAPVECPVADFLKKAPSPPPVLIVTNALQMLKKIDAMNVWEDLTELGYHLAKLRVEPHLGKMVLCAIVLKCLDPVLTIACTLAYRDPFVLPALASQKRAAMVWRKELAEGTFSDHMVLLRAFQAWQKAQRDGWERVFCERNFLSQATMEIIIGMRARLLGQLRALGFVVARGGAHIRDVNANSENWAVVKAALVSGMYPNLVHVDREKMVLTGPKEKVRFHPTSVLSQAQHEMIPPSNGQAAALQALPTDWLVYDEMTRAHRIANIRCCSVVTPVTVVLFSGPARLPHNALQEPLSFQGNRGSNDDDSDSGMEDNRYNMALLKLDEWLHFKLDPDVAGMLMQLRLKWHSLLLRRMRAPSKPWSQADEVTLSTVVSVLSTEEQHAGLLQPAGIGRKPRPVSYNELPSAPTWRSAYSSAETELSDDSSDAEKVLRKSVPPAFHQPWKSKEKNTSPYKRNSDNKSGQSSVKPMDSTCCPNPCASPSLVSGKDCETPPPRLNMPVRYFIMKCRNWQNLNISQQKGVWSTTPSNEQKLNGAFCESSLVYLIFSVQRSGCFQGFGRMSSEIKYEQNQCWGSTGLEGVFKVEWIQKESIPFCFTRHLLNPWNGNKEVQISRDGQELEPQVGEQLLQLWGRIHSAGKALTDNPWLSKYYLEPAMCLQYKDEEEDDATSSERVSDAAQRAVEE